MPRSLSGRNMCRPPIDCRSSSAHTLNSTTCPAARVWPWCHRASMFKAQKLSFTAWVGTRRSRLDTDSSPNHHEDQISEERNTSRQAALQAQCRAARRGSAHEARLAHRRAQDAARNPPLHRGGDGLQAAGKAKGGDLTQGLACPRDRSGEFGWLVHGPVAAGGRGKMLGG